jgi:hypothetical protein
MNKRSRIKALTLLLAGGLALGNTGCASLAKNKVAWEITHSPEVPQEYQRQVIDRAQTDIDNGTLTRNNYNQYFQNLRNEVQGQALAQATSQVSNLPMQTKAEKDYVANNLGDSSILFVQNGAVYEKKLTDGTVTELTSPITQLCGPIQNPKAISQNEIMFVKKGQIYKATSDGIQRSIDLVVPGTNIIDYTANENNVVYVEALDAKTESIGKANADGSNLEQIITSKDAVFSGLSLSPDGTEAVCSVVYKSPINQNHRIEHIRINLETKKYQTIGFPERLRNSVERVDWYGDTDNIMFTLNEGQAGSDVYTAELTNEGSENYPRYTVKDITRLTFEGSPISIFKNTDKGLLYVAQKNVPTVYLKNDETNVRLYENFSGEDLSLVDSAVSAAPATVVPAPAAQTRR